MIRLKHLLETKIDDLYLRDLDETIRSLDVSAILNLTIIVTDQEKNSSIISSFIDDVSVGRIHRSLVRLLTTFLSVELTSIAALIEIF